MGNNSKISLSFGSVLAIAVGVVMTFGHGYRTPPSWHIWLSRGLIAVGVIGLAIVVWALMRRDRAPDFLRQRFRNPFECNGLFFMVMFETHDEIAHLVIAFQNRYSRPCIPTIKLTHQVRFRQLPLELPPIEFAVDGGEFGVCRMPINIPEQLRGCELSFDLTGRNHFPEGRGRMLLFRDGMAIGKWEQKALNYIMVAAAVTGHIHIARAANITLCLPSAARSFDSILHPNKVESIWTPDDVQAIR